LIQAVVQGLSQQQQQQQVVVEQQAAAQGQEAPPPPYSANAITLSDPQYDSYKRPQYYSGNIPSVTASYSQSSSSPAMWRPVQQSQSSSQQYQSGGGYNQQYNPQQYRQQSCCTLS
jgi:hypothetical protein